MAGEFDGKRTSGADAVTVVAEKLLQEALGLSEADRADLAASLISSLDEKFDEEAQAAWDAEILRRVSDLDTGVTKPIPWAEARRMMVERRDATPGP
jgi:putative addiction module component (TIGR02574 family)